MQITFILHGLKWLVKNLQKMYIKVHKTVLAHFAALQETNAICLQKRKWAGFGICCSAMGLQEKLFAQVTVLLQEQGLLLRMRKRSVIRRPIQRKGEYLALWL